MPERGEHLIIGAQKLFYGLPLGGGFDDDKVLRHGWVGILLVDLKLFLRAVHHGGTEVAGCLPRCSVMRSGERRYRPLEFKVE